MTRGRSAPRRRGAAGAIAIVVASLLVGPHTSLTEAAFTDSEYASGTVTAATLQRLTATCTAVSLIPGALQNLDVRWTAPAAPTPTGYTITLTRNGTTAATFTAAAGSTSYLVGGALLGGLLQAGTYSVTVTSTLGNWRSIPSPAFNADLAGVTGWTCV